MAKTIDRASSSSTLSNGDAARDDALSMVQTTVGPFLGSCWLFGSRARGDHRPSSDWDIAVVVTPAAPWRELENQLRNEAAAYWSRSGTRLQFHVISVSVV